MDYTVIRYEKDATDRFATIIIARPEKMNAMNKDVVRQIDHALAAAVADPEVNALILTGGRPGVLVGLRPARRGL